jgi:hypothetical protein
MYDNISGSYFRLYIFKMKTILLLGSGLMADSVVLYLLNNVKVSEIPHRIAFILRAITWKRRRS